MAEENQAGQGANPLPPQDQPNEPLPRSYNQLLESDNNPKKTSWPELVGVSAEEAKKKIKEEMDGAEIQVVPPGHFVTCDFQSQRVRLYVDESEKVNRTPMIG